MRIGSVRAPSCPVLPSSMPFWQLRQTDTVPADAGPVQSARVQDAIAAAAERLRDVRKGCAGRCGDGGVRDTHNSSGATMR